MDLPPVAPHRDWAWTTPDRDPVAIAFVGLGGFTTDWVLPSAAAADGVTVGAVVSGSAEKATRVAGEYDATALSYQAYADGEARDRYDAVYVATPNATHLDHVETAARHGKAVLCEKPVETTADRARRLRDACADADVVLQVAYRLQVDPVVRWARAVIDNGGLGTPVHAQATMSQDLFTAIGPTTDQWRLDPDLAGGCALIDLGIYPLNTLRFLTGQDPIRVQATTQSPDPRFDGVDQDAALTLSFADGLVAAVTASQLSARGDHLHLVGTDAELVLDPAFFGEVTATVVGPEDSRSVSIDTNEMRRQLEYFAAHVQTGERPEPDGDHALVDAATIDAAYESAATGDAIEVDPPD
ncbi:MAG: D-xylose 1-dehydrogenase Gfo6 [Halobacteriaceae archaeon]